MGSPALKILVVLMIIGAFIMLAAAALVVLGLGAAGWFGWKAWKKWKRQHPSVDLADRRAHVWPVAVSERDERIVVSQWRRPGVRPVRH